MQYYVNYDHQGGVQILTNPDPAAVLHSSIEGVIEGMLRDVTHSACAYHPEEPLDLDRIAALQREYGDEAVEYAMLALGRATALFDHMEDERGGRT